MDAPICPECRQGKHMNCDGHAWDDEADRLTDCGCGFRTSDEWPGHL